MAGSAVMTDGRLCRRQAAEADILPTLVVTAGIDRWRGEACASSMPHCRLNLHKQAEASLREGTLYGTLRSVTA